MASTYKARVNAAGLDCTIEIDFRTFVNSMRRKEQGFMESTTDPELRRRILLDIANSGYIFANRGPDSGATDASIEAIQRGESIHQDGFPSKKKPGAIRMANAEFTDKGFSIDPTENGRSYGGYSVANYVTEYDFEDDRYKINDEDVHDVVYDIIKKHILRS